MSGSAPQTVDPKERVKSLRDLAQWYHSLGANLAPLGNDKRPVIVNIWNGAPVRFKWQEWETLIQTDKHWQQIRGGAFWGDAWGVAVINGVNGWANIDIDSRAKNDPARPPVPREVAEAFLQALGLPSDYSWLIASPTGGWHVYVRVETLSIEKGKLSRPHPHPSVDHVELRFTGHYTALPGSLHPNGKLYEFAGAQPTEAPAWVDGDALLATYSALTIDPPKPASSAPARSTSTAQHSAYVAKAVDEECRAVASAPDGSRNDTLNHSAFALGTLVGAGALAQGDAEQALLSAALSAGLTESEALATIASGLTSGCKSPRQLPESTARPAGEANDWIESLFVSALPDPWAEDDAIGIAGEKPRKARQRAPVEDALSVSETIELFLTEIGPLSFSELDDNIYLKGKPLTDAHIAPLKVMIHDHNGRRTKESDDPFLPIGAVEPVLLQIASRKTFHPVRDWIQGLAWDNKPHINTLASHFADTHPPIKDGKRSYSVFEALLSLWLIGAVDRVMTGAQNPVLVLAGPQGIGKSFLPWWLAQPIASFNGFDPRNNPFFCEGNINPESIEHQRRLVSKLIWEIGEVGATMRRADQDTLKQFLTESSATFRVPYAKYEITKPALCSWIATVNPTVGFLNDPTGNRRFRTVELKSIDWNYSKAIDPVQVWAQAVHWWRNGATADLSPIEKTVISQINNDHSKTSDEIEAIMTRYEFDAAEESWHVYTADVVEDLIRNVPACKTTNITRVGSALAQLTGRASKRLKGNAFDGRSGYLGVRKLAETRNQYHADWSNGMFGS